MYIYMYVCISVYIERSRQYLQYLRQCLYLCTGKAASIYICMCVCVRACVCVCVYIAAGATGVWCTEVHLLERHYLRQYI
jgi:hypothetical protein